MNVLTIILIVLGCIVGLILLLFVLGKISTSTKKVASSALGKRFAKQKPENSAQKKEDKSTAEIDLTVPNSSKKKVPIITDFEGFEPQVAPKENVPESTTTPLENRRMTIEEIMRNRELAKQKMPNPPPQIFNDEDDDEEFEKFRQAHSSYTKYMKDQNLIDQIKDLSPEMKAVVFSNLFKRIDKD